MKGHVLGQLFFLEGKEYGKTNGVLTDQHVQLPLLFLFIFSFACRPLDLISLLDIRLCRFITVSWGNIAHKSEIQTSNPICIANCVVCPPNAGKLLLTLLARGH